MTALLKIADRAKLQPPQTTGATTQSSKSSFADMRLQSLRWFHLSDLGGYPDRRTMGVWTAQSGDWVPSWVPR